jgi:DNA polymerase-1
MADKQQKQKVFLIVDALALLHRAFHAIPPLQDKSGRVVNAVYGFFSILIRAMNETHADYLAVTFDRKAPTFRHEAYKEYKAGRATQPQDFYDQIPMTEKILNELKVPVLFKEGYEADDIIATLCEKMKKEKGLRKIILTGDKDTLQLVNATTAVLTPGQGIKETVLYDEAKVRERFGLAPEQMVDFKALRGDPSDNIPGVRGIGEVGAAKLLADFGTLEKLYKELEKDSAKAEKIPGKQKAALIEFKKDAFKAKELVQLVFDVPVDFSLKDGVIAKTENEKLAVLFGELGFKSILPRAEEVFGTPATSTVIPAKAGIQKGGRDITHPTLPYIKGGKRSVGDIAVKTDAEIAELVKTLKEREKFAMRSLYRGSFLDKKLVAIAFAWADAKYVLPATPAALKKLTAVFADRDVGKICHDAKREIETLGEYDLKIEGLADDVMLASYVLAAGTRAHDLEALALNELGVQFPAVQASLLPSDDLEYPRLAAEVEAVWRLAPIFEKRLREENLIHILKKFELPLAPVLASMEKTGVKIDSAFLEKLSEKLSARIDELQKKIIGYAGAEINVNSAKQIAEVLFEKLKIQEQARVRKTAGGGRYSTAAGELEKLKDSHPIVPLILEHRELAKLVSTYTDALPKLVRPDTKRVHTTFNQTVTATGRLSSSDPNLQNIPIRTELGREIRKAFVAPAGSELIVADYSQFELRILAHLSEDPALSAAFKKGEDIHRRTASEVWGVAPEKVTKEQRSAAKAINFGIAYGMGENALAESAGIPRHEARAFIDKYFLTFPKVGEWLENTKALAYAQGYVETLFGRRRYLPELKSHIPYLRAAGERMAINAPIQGTNADAIKLAMVELHKILAERFGLQTDADAKMILQVHDELVFEVKKGLAKILLPIIREKMEGAIQLRVPVKVDIRVGKSWGELENIEEEHEEPNI